MNILQQYRQAVAARDRRLGSFPYLITIKEYKKGDTFTHWDDSYCVGDEITLCYEFRENSYGTGKVVKHLGGGEYRLKRTA